MNKRQKKKYIVKDYLKKYEKLKNLKKLNILIRKEKETNSNNKCRFSHKLIIPRIVTDEGILKSIKLLFGKYLRSFTRPEETVDICLVTVATPYVIEYESISIINDDEYNSIISSLSKYYNYIKHYGINLCQFEIIDLQYGVYDEALLLANLFTCIYVDVVKINKDKNSIELQLMAGGVYDITERMRRYPSVRSLLGKYVD